MGEGLGEEVVVSGGFGGGLGWRGGGGGLRAQLQMLDWEFGALYEVGMDVEIGLMGGSCC